MYLVTAYDTHEDTQGTVIHSPYVDGLKVRFTIHQRLRGISNMAMYVMIDNPAYGKLNPLNSFIKVEDVRDGTVLFEGRVLKPTQTMSRSGLFTLRYEVESKLAYLRDSHQRYAKIQDTTPAELFEFLINVHNQQMPPYKQFKVGNVTVTNPTDNVYRYVGYGDTYDEIQDNLIDRLGGYLVVREESDGTYLDYLAEVGEVRQTPIRLRSNLQDFRREIDPTDIKTRIIPLGARIEPEEGESIDASMPRIDAKSVNDGLDYFENQDLIDEFGVIEGTIIFNDITQPSYLKLRAEQFFESQRAARTSYDVTALNLDLIDLSFEAFKVGDWYVFDAMDISETLQIVEISIDSENPQKHILTIGDRYQTLSQYQAEMNRKTLKIDEVESDLVAQRQAFQKAVESIVAQTNTLQKQIDDIDVSEIPQLEQAITNLNDALDSLIDAVDEIPIYSLATPTEDGLMSSADKQKLDTLESYDVATSTEDGLMSSEDKIKLDFIDVTEPIDLQDVLERLEALENG